MEGTSASTLGKTPPVVVSSGFPPGVSVTTYQTTTLVLSLAVNALDGGLPVLLSDLKEVSFLVVFSAVGNARTVAFNLVSTGSYTVVLKSNVHIGG